MERQIITVDIAPGKGPVKCLKMTQGDIGRKLGVYIKQNGLDLDCSAYTAELYVLKPDGNYFSSILAVDATDNNLITWETAAQETPLSGECAAQIRIRQGTINIGTANFVEYIEESPNQIGIDSITEVYTIEQYVAMAGEKALEAATSAQNAIVASSHYPRIDTTTQKWEVWDVTTSQWVDTGISAGGAILSNVEVETADVSVGTVAASDVLYRANTINKTGFYPIGIVGSYVTASGYTYAPLLGIKDERLETRTSEQAKVRYILINNDGIEYRNVILHFDILWVKITT